MSTMTTATDNAARRILDAWTDLTANDFAQLTSDNGMEVDGCAVWIRSSDNTIVAFRQLEDGPEEWTEIPAPATTRMRLILDNPEHTDLGPATPDHIAEMEAVEAKGQTAFAVDPETLEVIRPGQFGYDSAVAVWVD